MNTPRWTLVAAFISLTGLGPAMGQPVGNVLGPLNDVVDLPEFGGQTAGFETSISVSDMRSVGYTSVKIICTSSTQLPADRRLVYRFRTLPGGESPPRNGLVVNVPVLFRQGTKTESCVRLLPKWSTGQAIEIHVLEDGRELPGYIGFVGQPRRFGRGVGRTMLSEERQINWVFLSAEDTVKPIDIPDLRAINHNRNLSYTSQLRLAEISPADLASWKAAAVGPELLAIGQNDLPLDWRSYQRYDVIITNQRAVERLASRDLELRALRYWILHGGSILVYDAESIEAVLEALNVSHTRSDDSRSQIAAAAGEMNYYINLEEKSTKEQVEKLKRYLKAYAGTEQPAEGDTIAAVYLESDLVRIHNTFAGDVPAVRDELELEQARLAELSQIPRYATTKWVEQVWTQPTGAGTVIGIKASDEYDVPPLLHWKVATRSIGYRLSPMLRRGVDPMLGDRRFARWLIPGVAQPPVYTFMGLLTAFVVLVGPVAYRRTAKQGRSYLMFAIAPVLALLTTVAMFGYGIISDGFSTVVRARQLTWVDGKSGDAGERVRATYFAGVRPQEGLRFAPDAEVFHYPEGTGRSWREANDLSPATLGSITVREDAQLFDASFLPSRQQRQFVIHGPRKNAGFLKLVESDDLNAPRRVENGFDFKIREVVIRDHLGNYWHADELDGGATGNCRALAQKESSKMLGRLYNDHRPISEVRETGRSRKNYGTDVYDVLVDINQQMKFDSVTSDGIYEEWLQEHLQEMGDIPADHFVAIADVSEDVLATESEAVSSIRYVFGTLR